MRLPSLYTVGHSNRSLDELIALLCRHKISQLVDVRSYPQSRRYPCFNRNTLSLALEDEGIAYVWLGKELGGMRHTSGDSPHSALTNSSFRGYADHMAGHQFKDGVDTLTRLCQSQNVAIMCAERSPCQCHRGMIADYLSVQGWNIQHIINNDQCEPHTLNPLARTSDDTLIYDKLDQEQLNLKF